MVRFFVLCLLFLFCNQVYSQYSREKLNKVEAEVKEIMDELHVIGLSVAVVNKGEIVYQKSFGNKSIDSSNSAKKEMLCDEHIFRIASISKTFVATAILQLVENGKLNLNDHVNHFLDFKISNPNYPYIPITIKMLLSHRSSINDKLGYNSFNHINPEKGNKYQLCYNDYAPGEGYQYCNYNYTLLGAIIEKVSGERFDNYIENHITAPLGLKCSFNVDKLDSSLFVPLYKYDEKARQFKLMLDVYKSYAKQLKGYKMGISTPCFVPAGGMKIATGDLAKYMIMHMQDGIFNHKRIITRKSEKQMRNVLTPESSYALSFREYKNLIPHETLYGQTGGAYGLYSAMIFHSQKKYGFVIITNGCLSKFVDGYHDLHKSLIKCLYNNLIVEK